MLFVSKLLSLELRVSPQIFAGPLYNVALGSVVRE